MTAMKEQPSARQIYGTIGPACADVETLEAMFRAGMTGIRLNLSHVTLAQAADQVDALHKAAQRCGKQAELLIDMQGPELRVGVLAEPMTLHEGEVLELGGKGIPLPEIAIPALLTDQEVLLDDGKLLLRVTEQTETGAVAEVLRGGVLRGRKSLALPGADLEPPTMTASDVENIRVAASPALCSPLCAADGIWKPSGRHWTKTAERISGCSPRSKTRQGWNGSRNFWKRRMRSSLPEGIWGMPCPCGSCRRPRSGSRPNAARQGSPSWW